VSIELSHLEAVQAVHRARQQLETALRVAGHNGFTQRDMADALGLPMNTCGSLNRRWNLELYR
jgi:DNA-directed RNA polymerase specialized sigma24 family protein